MLLRILSAGLVAFISIVFALASDHSDHIHPRRANAKATKAKIANAKIVNAKAISTKETKTQAAVAKATAAGDAGDKAIPPRPKGVDKDSFHGNQFASFEENGFVTGSPAVEAAPVFLYSRTSSLYDPCYPESAIVIGSDPPEPNPGTGGEYGPIVANPGDDCTDPGPYTGAYSQGNPFPVYVGAAYCEGDKSWRVNYDLYYVHDGALSEGHKHDWEGATVVFREDPGGENWWYRHSMIYNKHSWEDQYAWSDLITVSGSDDVENNTPGRKLNHAKVFVGFFSHASFKEKDTTRLTPVGAATQGIANDEYRSDDWWRIPHTTDFMLWSVIDPDWDYGDASSTPPSNMQNVCSWGDGI